MDLNSVPTLFDEWPLHATSWLRTACKPWRHYTAPESNVTEHIYSGTRIYLHAISDLRFQLRINVRLISHPSSGVVRGGVIILSNGHDPLLRNLRIPCRKGEF